jgi:heptaprenylglyceryl phosphate synthase
VVGGGLKTAKDIESTFRAGADLIILGNGCEKDPALIGEACSVRDKVRTLL